MSLRLNPEYEKLLPKMSEEEFAALKDSIREEGQHYAIIVNEDLEILDGHHRFRACNELGMEPDFEVRKFEDKLLEKKFVIEANLRRRHLNNFQLVELGVPLLEIEKVLARRRQAGAGKKGRNIQLGIAPIDAKPVVKAKATEVVAKKVGVSTRTFERGKKILEKASEEDKQKLREGKTSIAQVYREVVTPEQNLRHEEKINASIEKAMPDIAEALSEVQKNKIRNPEMNKKILSVILENLLKESLFCPSCGNNMFECDKCHKTLKESLESKARSDLFGDL
jgi:ParB-like chromosome segregation protein Spo0J